jgi:hypothetical protein
MLLVCAGEIISAESALIVKWGMQNAAIRPGALATAEDELVFVPRRQRFWFIVLVRRFQHSTVGSDGGQHSGCGFEFIVGTGSLGKQWSTIRWIRLLRSVASLLDENSTAFGGAGKEGSAWRFFN